MSSTDDVVRELIRTATFVGGIPDVVQDWADDYDADADDVETPPVKTVASSSPGGKK